MHRTPSRWALALVIALVAALALATQAGAAEYNVNSTADSSDGACTTDADGCTLRDAIEAANATDDADTVNVPAGRYVFDPEAGQAYFVNDPGGLTLVGAGSARTIIDANGLDRAFYIAQGLGQGRSFAASGITITGGLGGKCECAQEGGAIYVSPGASLALTDSVLRHNESSGQYGGGGAIAGIAADMKLTRVRIENNSASGPGGAILAEDSALTVVDSYLHHNDTPALGGAVSSVSSLGPCQCSELERGASAPALQEGAVPGDLSIQNSTLSDNSAGFAGGAVFTAVGSGVLLPAFAAPAAGSDATILIANSTLSGNVANTSAQGGFGGAIAHLSGTAALVNDTISENRVLDGDGSPAGGGGLMSADVLTLKNTIVSDSKAAGIDDNCFALSDSAIVSLGNNIASDDTCSLTAAGDKPSTDPRLGVLRDNGGPTPTQALFEDSPAIDAADNAAGPALDQRGGNRPPEGGSPGTVKDIGAYEAHSLADLTVEAKAAAPDPATAGSPLTYTLVVSNNGPDAINGVHLSDPLPGGVALVSVSTNKGTCTGEVACSLGTLAVGDVAKVTVVVTPSAAGTLRNTATVSANGIKETEPANDSANASTTVNAAPEPAPAPAPVTPEERDTSIDVSLKVPETVTIDQFFAGITAESECKDEACLRRFREHAAINTGATHIAGFNLTVTRGSLGFAATTNKIKLRPCVSGSASGKPHSRCVRNLRKSAEKAGHFRVKVVVSAVDKAGNRQAKKAYVTVKG
ncbi:MAG: hypothetical protein QOJ07_2995 [Thermoleophilaceae bacterium]|nr:hypothetical protein [Thermoleophilaceae bacterium]